MELARLTEEKVIAAGPPRFDGTAYQSGAAGRRAVIHEPEPIGAVFSGP